MNLPLSITPEDYKNSSGFLDINKCPLAVAIKRQYPQFTNLAVGTETAYYGDDNPRHKIKLREPFGIKEYRLVVQGSTFETELIS